MNEDLHGFFDFWGSIEGNTRSQDGTDEDIAFLTSVIPVGATVLDAPCGTGRVSTPLLDAGYLVTGIDINPDFLSEAKKGADGKGDFLVGDMEKMGFYNEFSAVINMWTSFGYLGDEDDARLMKTLAKAVVPGGLVVIDTSYTAETVLPWFGKTDEKKFGDVTVVLRRSYDVLTSWLDTEWIVGGESRTVSLKIYSCREIVEMMRAAGLGDIQARSAVDKPFSIKDGRVFLTGVKIG